MTCGEKGGHLTARGTLCAQNIPRNGLACIWHSRDAAERKALALKGSISARMKIIACLPGDTPSPVLDNPAGVRKLITETIQDARTGKLDHRIAMAVFAGTQAALKLAELELSSLIGQHEKRLGLRA